MKRSKKAIARAVVAILLVLGVLLEGSRVYYTWNQRADRGKGYTVVIDPGHGGIQNGPKSPSEA